MSASKWKLASVAEPCTTCGHTDWCQRSADGAVEMCMRNAEGSFKSGQTRDGADYWLHRPIPLENLPGYKPVTVEPDGQCADVDTRHAVYSALAGLCPYSDSHRIELNRRKAQQPYGNAGSMYGTMPKQGRGRIVAKLREKFSDKILLSVPGFVLKVNGKGERYIGINGKAGLMIPVRDDAGRIVGIKIRVDGAAGGGGGKYRWLSSRKTKYLPFDGPSPGTPAHCPLSIKARPVVTVRITEGPLKADVATNNGDTATIAADGVGSCLKVIPLIQALGCSTVRLAFDMDREKNPQVAGAFIKLAGALEELKIDVEIETWPAEHKGIDDALVAGASIDVIRGEDVGGYLLLLEAIRKKNSGDSDDDGRVEIEISVDEHETNDDAAEALVKDREIYQRNGALVWIVRDEKRNDGIRRPDDVPQIVALKAATVRERLSRVARFGQTVIDPESGEEKFVRKPIPKNCVEAIMGRGHWPGIRALEGVVTTPVLRRDGSILNTPGYDVATGLMFDPRGLVFSIPERPTHDDAIAAVGRLLDLVSDFPFATAGHRSAWLAGLLTPLARYAFDGPAPLFLFDANVRGAGKTLLAELIALILTGGDFSRMSNPQDDAECRKLITALVLCGDTLVLIDNIAGMLGCPALDAALTGTTWKDRLLGKNERIVGTLGMIWYASGNNVVLNGDTTRRTCQARLESPEERPEERQGFKYPNITQYVREHRPELLADVLTVLSAYCVAGRPRAGLKPWGSFDGWSNLIRQCVVWAGLEDPGQTRQELSERSDRDAEQLRELIAGWQEIDLDCTGLTCADALQRLSSNHAAPRLRNVLANLYDLKPGELPGAKKLGNRLRQLRGRVCGGKTFDDKETNRDGVKVWRIVDLARRNGACRAGSAASAGSVAAFLRGTEGEKQGDDTHTHIRPCGNRVVADPANPADPATWIMHSAIGRATCTCTDSREADGQYLYVECYPAATQDAANRSTHSPQPY